MICLNAQVWQGSVATRNNIYIFIYHE